MQLTLTYVGPPNHHHWAVGDTAIDSAGAVWYCSVAGLGGSTASFVESSGGGGGSGTVTSASVVTANGFSGTVATATTTPAITLKTSVQGVLKGNSGTGVISAATAGTDYAAGTSGSATGLVVSTTGTGALTTVAAPVGTVVGTSDAQTLTNKTLTAPVISTITNTGTLTLPTSTDTLVGRATTDTLTNKRITKRVLQITVASGATQSPTVNTDNYDVVEITAITATITSMTTNLTGTPAVGDTLRYALVSAAVQTITAWGTAFEGDALPTATIAGRLDLQFYWNAATSKWRLVGTTYPSIVYQDLGTTNSGTLSTTPTTIFNPTLGVGVWDIDVVMNFAGEGAAGILYVAAISGGTAVYTLPSTSGNPIGARAKSPTATAADNATTLTFKAVATVTTAGTVIVVAGVATGGSGTPVVGAQDASLTGLTIQISSVTCRLIG